MPIGLVVLITALFAGLAIAVYWRTRTSSRLHGLLFLTGIGIGAVFAFEGSGTDVARGWASITEPTRHRSGKTQPAEPLSEITWPPVLNARYPDLNLVDQTGRQTSLSEFRGKVVLVEPIGLPCRACIAYAGGHEYGPFAGIAPQEDLESIEHYARRFGQVDLDDERLVVVQILFYDRGLASPSGDDARQWAEHFRMDRSRGRVVLVAEPRLLGPATWAMIPGFQLLDRDLVLRYDSTGPHPRHDLYHELLPAIGTLLAE